MCRGVFDETAVFVHVVEEQMKKGKGQLAKMERNLLEEHTFASDLGYNM